MAHQQLLFIGRPDATEVAHWSTLRELAPQRGWVPTRKFEPGKVTWAVAASSLLADQADVVDALREADVPCTTALDAIKNAYS
ncbi:MULTISPECIES: hypothetical protein [unclassified Rhodococcus (in: high G+C Gram-positive bacteria)]|uniref:hypothetical protein n=1 Tax=Rhodococcus sp. SJ-3 TaxID=3454628 RepID=UPI003F795403